VTDRRRLPPWLTKPLTDPERVRGVRRTLRAYRLNTVCDEARCPNRVDCFTRGTATFMVLGDRCTRNCRFCAVEHSEPRPVETDEPERVAAAARELGLQFVVLTSVTRDDLPDGGAAHFAASVAALRRVLPDAGVEVLVPDFLGDTDALETVLDAHPTVFGHNVETVARLYDEARPGADYERSLEVLGNAHRLAPEPVTKSALMLGLGETQSEIETTLRDLRDVGVEIVCLGQYLSPSADHHPVERYVRPEEFDELEVFARSIGFSAVASGPFVRSSYLAEESAAEALATRGATIGSTEGREQA